MTHTLSFVSYEEMLKRVDEGWLIQYRGKGLISSWIRLVTGGVHSHTAMVVRKEDGSLAVAEMREFKGGRITSLWDQWQEHGGRMDFFKPDTERYPELDLKLASEAMKFIARHANYSYFNLVRILVRKIPFIFRLFDPGVHDNILVDVHDRHLHCSDSVAAAYQYGGVDPCPWMPNFLVAPNDLTKSLLFKYQFSL